MADIKESAMTQQSDCKWVRALDANGNSIRISKEDLASVVGGLIGVATYKGNGLLSKQMATFGINFSNSDICINFSTPYNLQPFFITCYLNGSFSTYLINPSTYQALTYFKVKYLGRQDIEVYAKPGDGRVFIKTNATDNGRLSFQFMYERTANILNIENSITPEDFTKINMSEM